MAKRETIGVALSGGGIKSFSQYPFLSWCLSEGIELDVIAGTSMGSILAALYASGLNSEQIKTELMELESYVKKNRLIRPSLKVFSIMGQRIYGGLTDGEPFEALLSSIFHKYGVRYMQDTKVPMAINAVDLVSGKTVVFVSDASRFDFSDYPDWIIEENAPIEVAVRASCSYPMVFAYCPYKNYHLVDGGVRMNVPVPLLTAFGASVKIAITANEKSTEFNSTRISSIANRVISLMANESESMMLKEADLVLNFPLSADFLFKVGKGREVIDFSQDLFSSMQETVRDTITPKQIFNLPWLSLFKRRK